MATDILASDFQFAIHIENARRVDSAGSREINLRLSQFSRERKQCVDVDPNIYGFDSGKFCRMASMLDLPQIPQLLEIVPKRCTEFSFTFTPAARSTITTLSRVSEIPAISRGSRTIASETRNPAASSSSCPGVRMVVAKVFRPIRISSGSSIVRSSCE